MICKAWCFSQKYIYIYIYCKVTEWKQEHIDFCTRNISFIYFKTNGLLAKHPNYLNMAFK